MHGYMHIGDDTKAERLRCVTVLRTLVSKFKLSDFAVCIRACDDTLQLDPTNVKAYYRSVGPRSLRTHA